jgi:hypothetical protein
MPQRIQYFVVKKTYGYFSSNQVKSRKNTISKKTQYEKENPLSLVVAKENTVGYLQGCCIRMLLAAVTHAKTALKQLTLVRCNNLTQQSDYEFQTRVKRRGNCNWSQVLTSPKESTKVDWRHVFFVLYSTKTHSP